MGFSILAINPGASSTKVALFDDESLLWSETVYHPQEELSAFGSVFEQRDYRLKAVLSLCREHGLDLRSLSAVVGRGGVLDPMEGGTYAVNEAMLQDLARGKPWEHASNLGGVLARLIGEMAGVLSCVVADVSVDEFEPISYVTGLPELPKRSLSHALNIKAVVRRASRELGGRPEDFDFVVAHLGSGVSVCAHRRGRMIDVNNANEFGPMSPERAGGVPAGDLVGLCYSGRYGREEIRRMLVGEGGLKGYLGTSDVRRVKEMIASGDARARLVYEAMAYQVAKEIGMCAVSLEGRVDAVLITGGVAHDPDFVELVRSRVQWIAPVLVYPGEDEMAALAQGALAVLRGEEPLKTYKG